MKTINRLLHQLTVVLTALFLTQAAAAQTGVLNYQDPIQVYNPASPPATPGANTLVKWVKTNRLGWNTSSFKCYFYNNIAFRIKWPKSFTPGNGKTYPIYVFFHGVGERGTIYDNEFQLFHGGQTHSNAVDNGTFDGFLLYPQTSSASGGWSDGQLDVVANLIRNYLIPEQQVDPFRVIVNGLSGGGGAAWTFMNRHKTLTAAGIPMSGSAIQNVDDVPGLVWNPFWLGNGGLDNAPSPYTVNQVLNAAQTQGCNYRHSFYPNLGHGVWNDFWAQADYFPYMLKAHKANPWARYGRTEFCPGDPINVTLGVTAGFDGYRWRKDGVLIDGATSNTLQVTTTGVYDCQILRGGQWSVWSPIPVQIKLKAPTVSPDITVTGLFSKVLPSVDGKTSVNLEVPTGYTSYTWQKLNPTTALASTTNTLTNVGVGAYQVRVTEQFGCSSSWSNTFTVVDAGGPNPPDAPTGLLATALSQTQIRLDWAPAPSPAFVETAFEVYQALAADGPYRLIGFAPSRAATYLVSGLDPNKRYYFKLRAINETAAAPVASPASALTFSDNQLPTPPNNLRTGSIAQTSVQLLWDASTDNSGIKNYDVFVNGALTYTVDGSQTSVTVYNLLQAQYNTFKVVARDLAGNLSSPSNQVVAAAAFSGLSYKHYTFAGTWNNLADFNTLTPVAVGNVPNVTLNNRVQEDNYAYLWEGFITIPTTGTYYFRTNSDDGSRLWLGSLNGTTSPYSFSGTPLVNNDGLHGSQNVTSSAKTLQAGVYPIAIAFYEQGGDAAMTVSWRTPSTGSSYVTIPNSAFQQTLASPGSMPDEPSQVKAQAVSSKKIQLTWVDNSNNETGFEIYRSTSINGTFTIIGTAAANQTSYSDSLLNPATTYFYKLKAISDNGSSDLVPSGSDAQAQWKFNGNYQDASPNNKGLTPSGSPTFDAVNFKEGTHSLSLNGTSQHVDISTSSGDYLRGEYTAKSIAFWMKSNSNTGNRVIVDIGGSDNGMALRLDGNTLYAGISRTVLSIFNTRKNISTSYNTSEWRHIGVVFSNNSLKLYVNGVLAAQNNDLGIDKVYSTSNASRIGTTNGSNAFNSGTGRFNGLIDNFTIVGRALTQSEIAELMTDSYGVATATTLSLPALPLAPSSLVGVASGPSRINLSWTNNTPAASVVRYEIWRSATNNANYELAGSVSGAQSTFSDSVLSPSTTYYHKVVAINEAGSSAFSNEINTTTPAAPVTTVALAVIPTQNITNNTTVNVALSATTDLGTHITYSASGLPAFASLQDNGNGTGAVVLSPSADHLGSYSVTVTATDNFGGTQSRSFQINVSGKNQTTINVNFNQTLPQAAPWNNTNSAPTAGATFSNFKDLGGNTTTVGLTILNAFTGAQANAVTTGNNSGVFPDNVMKTMYYGSNNTPYQFRINGLSASKKYSLVIFAGYPWTAAQQTSSGTLIGNYTVGTQTVTLNAANNTTQTVRINNISADASGQVVVTLTKATGAGFVLINAMQILTYDDDELSVLKAPTSLKAVGVATDKIRLSWSAASQSRTGFEIWRSTTQNGTYTQVGTVGGNEFTFTNTSLAANSTFFYKVRSVNGATLSAFSSPVGASTVRYVVNLNLNSEAALSQAAPWNNLNTLVYEGYVLDNMMNSQGQSTGINFTVSDNFTSFHDGFGITTGNNSGVVPDNVMKSMYYVSLGDTARFAITGLNRNHVYNIEFFGGSTFPYPSNSVYVVRDQSGQLSTLNNTTQTVLLTGFKPDENGTIEMTFYGTTAYSFLNSLTIYGMPAVETTPEDAPQQLRLAPPVVVTTTGAASGTTEQPQARVAQSQSVEVETPLVTSGRVYPNPFTSRVTVEVELSQAVDQLTLQLSDATGRTLSTQRLPGAQKGRWTYSLSIDQALTPGVYYLRVIDQHSKQPKVFKLLKTK